MGVSSSKGPYTKRPKSNMAYHLANYPHLQGFGLMPAINYAPLHYGPPQPLARRPRPRRNVTIDFITCGRRFQPDTRGTPCILRLSCINMKPPPSEMCRRCNGLDRELSDWLFRHGEYQEVCDRALDKIERAVDRWRPERHGPRLVAVIKCRAGVHRSVAMAEELARTVERWDGVNVTI
ncbi:MAG: hypothetical protein Q9208_008711, partial [Pyrenodesmia sp. 3 TL-2023]